MRREFCPTHPRFATDVQVALRYEQYGVREAIEEITGVADDLHAALHSVKFTCTAS